MSFSKRCKKELLKVETNDKYLEVELAAYLYFVGSVRIYQNKYQIVFRSYENAEARNIYKLIKRYYNYSPTIGIRNRKKFASDRFFNVLVEDEEIALKILKLKDKYGFDDLKVFNKMHKNVSEKKIFLKVAFILKGSINDPQRGYNLEIASLNRQEAEIIKSFMEDFNLSPKENLRRETYVIYIKDSEKISDFLALIGANKSLFDLENVRVLKSIRNDINRQTNFDKANIDRTVKASIRQVEAIEKLMKNNKFDPLSDDLKMIANLRLKYPYVSIEELGDLAEPALSKSKVNYRLQKLIKMAEDL